MINKYILGAVCSAIVGIFAYFLFFYSLPIPSYDDYAATIRFIHEFYFEDLTPFEKFLVLFKRHNEHRILASRSLAILYFYIFGKLNFTHLVIVQSVFLFGSIALIIKIMRQIKFPVEFSYAFCAVFLCSFSFYQVSFFYWGGIQYFTVMFFCILTLVLLNKAHKVIDITYLLSLATAFFAAFSFGNGFLCMLLGIFFLWAQRKKVLLIPWSILSIIFMYVQFFFKPNPDTPVHGPLQFDWVVRLLLTFSGSFLFVNPPEQHLRYINIIICSIAGFFVLTYWVYLFFSGFARKKPLLYSLLSLPLLTGIIISLSRFESKAAGGIAPRYMFFTALIPIALLLILWEKQLLTKKRFTIIFLCSTLVWIVSFLNNSNEFLQMNQDITNRIDLWRKDKNQRVIYFIPASESTGLLTWAISNKIIEIDTSAPEIHANK